MFVPAFLVLVTSFIRQLASPKAGGEGEGAGQELGEGTAGFLTFCASGSGCVLFLFHGSHLALMTTAAGGYLYTHFQGGFILTLTSQNKKSRLRKIKSLAPDGG